MSRDRVEEKSDLELFIELFGQIDLSRCNFKSEAPDLLVPHEGETLGIEHTRLYRENPALPSGSQLLPQEKLHGQLVGRAHQIFHDLSNQSLRVYVTFNEPSNYRQNDVEELAQILAQSVLTIISDVQASDVDFSGVEIKLYSWQAQELGIPFPAGINYYTVERNSRYEIWGPVYGYMVPHLSVQEIETVIRRKEARIEKYRARCTKIWLVIVTDIGLQSSHIDIPEDFAHQSFTTSFDRLFLLGSMGRNLIELQIEPPALKVHNIL